MTGKTNNQLIVKLLTEIKEAVIANKEYERGSESAMHTKTSYAHMQDVWLMVALLNQAGIDSCGSVGKKIAFCFCPEAEIGKEKAIEVLDGLIVSLTA